MAGSAVIGALRVELGLNSAAFDKGLKEASSSLGSFGSFAKKLAASLGTSLSVAGFAATIKSAVNEADNLNKASQKFGVPVEKLSELKYAADLADVSLEALGVGFKKLSKNMAEVAAGGGKAAAEAFQALGISVKDSDGTLKDSERVFQEVAQAFSKYADGANKTALAQAIFGKSGADLIPLLNAGAAGLREQTEEAHKLGVVITKETAVAAEEFNDNLTRIKSAIGGVTVQVTAALLPTMVNLSEQFVQLAKDGDLAKTAVDALKIVFKEGARFAVELNAAVQETTRIFTFLKEFTQTNTFEGVSAAWQKMNDDLVKINQDMQLRIRGINDETVGNLLGSVDAFIASMQKASNEKPEAPLVRTNAALDEMKRRAAEIEDEFKKITDSAKQVFESTRTPLEQYNLKMDELNELLKVGAISWDTYQRAVKKSSQDLLGTSTLLDDSFSALGDTFKDAFDGLINNSFDLQDSLLSLLGTLTELALNDFFKVLQQGNKNAGGGGGIFESLVGALAGSIPAFASGGSMKVGGSGGIDSKLAMFRVSPNERVDIRKPGQDRMATVSAPNFIVEDHRRGGGEMSMNKDASGDFRLFIRDAIRSELPGMMKPILANQYGINTSNRRR